MKFFKEINQKFKELNKSIDDSLSIPPKSSSHIENKVSSRNLSTFSPLRSVSSKRMSYHRQTTVEDVAAHINKHYNIDVLPEETRNKLLDIYKVNKEKGKGVFNKNFQVTLNKMLSSNGNQQYIDIYGLNDVEAIKCLNQCISNNSRKMLLGEAEKNKTKLKSIRRFQKRLGISISKETQD